MLQKFHENHTQQHISPTSLQDTAAVAVTDLTRRYRIGGNWKSALDGVTLRLEKGQIVGLIGPSGSGKSTLLRHITGLTLAENRSSRVEVLGHVVQQSGRAASDLRRIRRDIGFIFQQFNLVDRLSLLTNVLSGRLGRLSHLRRWSAWFTAAEVCDAMAALDRVGISAHADQRAGTLSGGQQQRAAIARVLVQKARLILADEPIASLDPESSRKVMEALRD
ncbi:MAG: ATP-binding cassette domain-containing protein, partial [Desulfopila sp.]|nr:ATP-binding cassette domain-containing protein [Desulfopila sp.]